MLPTYQPTGRSRLKTLIWNFTCSAPLNWAIGYVQIFWSEGYDYRVPGYQVLTGALGIMPENPADSGKGNASDCLVSNGYGFRVRGNNLYPVWQVNYGTADGYDENGDYQEIGPVPISQTFQGYTYSLDQANGTTQGNPEGDGFAIGPIATDSISGTATITFQVYQWCGQVLDTSHSGRLILAANDFGQTDGVTMTAGGGYILGSPQPIPFTYTWSAGGFSGSGKGVFEPYIGEVGFSDQAGAWASNCSVQFLSCTKIDGQTQQYTCSWNFSETVNRYTFAGVNIYGQAYYQPYGPVVIGNSSGSIGPAGVSGTVSDSGPVLCAPGNIDYGDLSLDELTTSHTEVFSCGFASDGYSQTGPDQAGYVLTSKICDIKGQFWCFKDAYPDNQGVIYTGPANPDGTNYKLAGSGPLDKAFNQLSGQITAPGNITQISQLDPFHVTADPDVALAAGDAPVYELPMGRAFYWPACTLSRQKNTILTPDTWKFGGNAESADGGSGLVSFRVSGPGDTVTGVFNNIKWMLAWRYVNVTVQAQPDDPNAPAATLRILLGTKGWKFTATGDAVQIDTCEPDGAYDYQDGQDSLWPLVPLNPKSGPAIWVPSQEREHSGINYLTQVVFDSCQPNVTYTVAEIAPFAVEDMEIECFAAQPGNFSSNSDNIPYFQYTDTKGIFIQYYGVRGFRVQCDGRLSLEFPWQLTDPFGELEVVGVASQGTVDGFQTLRSLFDYVNSIDGFSMTMAEDRSQWFNKLFPLDGQTGDLFAGGCAWNGTQMVDGTTLTAETSILLYYGGQFTDLQCDPGQGDLTTGVGYGNAKVPIQYNMAGHYRDRAWGVCFANHAPLSKQEIDCYQEGSNRFGGTATTRDDGWFETGLPYLLAGQVYDLEQINSTVKTFGRRSDKPVYSVQVALETGTIAFWLGVTFGNPIVRRWWHNEQPGTDFSEWIIDSTIIDATNLSLAFRAKGTQRLLATYASKKAGAAYVMGSYDYGNNWFPVLIMAKLTEYIVAVNPRTGETNYAYRNTNGYIVVDVYDGSDTLVGTYPSGGISMTQGGSPLAADSAPAICYPRDGGSNCQLSFVSGGKPLRFQSNDNARTWFPVQMSS